MIRAFKFVGYAKIADHLSMGWMVSIPNGVMHHHYYGIECAWLCDCEIPGEKMKAQEITAKAGQLISGDRERTHGDKVQNFTNIATFWDAFLEVKFGVKGLFPSDVAHMLSLMKKARTHSGEYNEDDAVDDVGYAAIAGELASKGM